MRLLYIWVSDKAPFENLSLNFDSGYRFTVERTSDSIKLECVETGEKLPPDFFNLPNGRCDITVSVVVGRNASGKTSVARYLERIRAFEDGSADFDYVLVYEKGERWFVQWYDSQSHLDRSHVSLDFTSKPVGTPAAEVCEGGNCKKNAALWNFEYAYYSPHFTTENQFLINSPAMENLSTNGIMYGGFEEQMGRPYDLNDHQSIQKNYLAVEHRMGISAIRNIPNDENGLKLPRPREIVISIHSVEYQENRRWLSAQKNRLKLALAEEEKKDAHSGIVDWLKGKIHAVEVLERSEEYYANRVHPKGSFLIRAFIAFVYTYIRIAGFFSNRYNTMFVDYAEYLLAVLSNLVLRFIYDDKEQGVFKIHYRLASALRMGVRLRGRRVGDFVEEDYPDELRERRSLARVFVRLAKWCKCRETEEHQSSIDEIHIKFGDVDRFSAFFDLYVVAMNRFDFLSFSYLPVMSSGDMSFLSMYARLYDFLSVVQESRQLRRYYSRANNTIDMPTKLLRRSFSDEMVVFLDEAETTLHPERQREIVLNTIRFFNCVGMAKSVHLIFATHSPIILSDVPIGNVVLLNRDGVKKEFSLKNTFGANIFDLYRDPFFMENGTTGSFSGNKVQKLIDKLNECIDKGLRTKCGFLFSSEERRLIDMIGDPMVRRYLRYMQADVKRNNLKR